MFCDPFLYLYSSAYLFPYALDLFKLYTNTPNCLDISFNFSFQYSLTLLQYSVVFWSLLVLFTHLLFCAPKALTMLELKIIDLILI